MNRLDSSAGIICQQERRNVLAFSPDAAAIEAVSWKVLRSGSTITTSLVHLPSEGWGGGVDTLSDTTTAEMKTSKQVQSLWLSLRQHGILQLPH